MGPLADDPFTADPPCYYSGKVIGLCLSPGHPQGLANVLGRGSKAGRKWGDASSEGHLDAAEVSYSTRKGGPSNSMPCARHSAGSCGGIALAFVTSRKKASILPAGEKATNIRPRVSPT